MKVAVLGAGTASAITLLNFFKAINGRYKDKDIQIDCIYDPNIPTVAVGEGVTLILLNNLQKVLNFSIIDGDILEIDGTIRWGAKYFWKDAINKDFTIDYEYPGMHFNSEKLSYWVLDKLNEKFDNFKIIKQNILKVEQRSQCVFVHTTLGKESYDYVIDCTGSPSLQELDSGDYGFPEFTSVNSVILYPEFKKFDEPYTSVYCHPHGWMFGIPLTHRKSYGYLYNNNFLSEEDAIDNFSKLKGIDASKLRRFSWRPYYRKKAMENRVLYMGNKLYFFEPHHQLPVLHYHFFSYTFIDELFKFNNVQEFNESMNRWNIDMLLGYQVIIAINYVSDNNYDTPFWNYAKKESFNFLSKSTIFKKFVNEVLTNGWNPAAKLSIHDAHIIRNYIEGYNIDLTKFKV
jgi:hypothetical protein